MSTRLNQMSVLCCAVLSIGIGILCCSTPTKAQGKRLLDKRQEEKYAVEREFMVDKYIAAEGVKNEAVLKAARTVPRHLFVSPGMRSKAYFDQALAIGHKQTISPPFVVAYMTEVIDPQPDDKVLEIGTGSGYQAAILGQIVKQVFSIEIVEPLGKAAADLLQDLGYDNIQTRVGDGYKGWPEEAPFDKIIVTCSPEKVPQPLVEQLKEGGKMIVPLGERYQQVFYLFEKKDGQLVQTKLLPTLFVPMTGQSEEQRKIKPDPLHPRIRNGSFETLIPDTVTPEGWHYQRQLTLMEKGAPDGKYFVTFENAEPGRFSQCLQAMALDGSKIATITVTASIKATQLRQGESEREQPALVISYFDLNRRELGTAHLGPWSGTFDWKEVTRELLVPSGAREAIMHLGLNGGLGSLSVDDIRLEATKRRN